MNFRDLPIRRKLLTIISIAAGMGLGLNLILFAAGDLRSKRNAMTSQLTSLAQIVAQASAPAIRFDDPDAANATLSGLAVRSEIVSALITLPSGRVIAQYPRVHFNTATDLPTLDAEKQGKKSQINFHILSCQSRLQPTKKAWLCWGIKVPSADN